MSKRGKKKKKKPRNPLAINAQFRNSAGIMGRISRKSERAKAKLELKDV